MTVSEYYTFKARLLKIEADLVQFLADIEPSTRGTFVHEGMEKNRRLAHEMFTRASDANVCLSIPFNHYRVETSGD